MATVTERAIRGAPQAARFGITPTPFQFVLTGEDNLRLTIANVVPGITVLLQARVLQPGQASPQSFEHGFQPNMLGDAEAHDIPMGVGAILNLVVRSALDRVQRGRCFVRVDVIRGLGVSATVLGTLLSGYLMTTGGRAWPGSPLEQPSEGPGWLRIFASSVPAAGAEAILTLNAGTRWRVLSAQAQLTTSVTAGTRNPEIELRIEGTRVWNGVSNLNHGADTNRIHTWGEGLAGAEGTNMIVGHGPLPLGAYLETVSALDASVRTNTPGLKVDDQWTALTVVVEEWRNPLLAPTLL